MPANSSNGKGRQTGTVRRYNRSTGYGEITPDIGTVVVGVHESSLRRAGIQALNRGNRVEYQEATIRGTIQAINVVLLEKPDRAPAVVEEGEVDRFFPANGYGFINSDRGERVYVSPNVLARSGLVSLPEKRRVRFESEPSRKGGLQATRVELI